MKNLNYRVKFEDRSGSYVDVELREGALSVSGHISGHTGQISEALLEANKAGKVKLKWPNEECLAKAMELGFELDPTERLCRYWNRWHLNGIRPSCTHQQKDPTIRPWEKVTLYEFGYPNEVHDKRREWDTAHRLMPHVQLTEEVMELLAADLSDVVLQTDVPPNEKMVLKRTWVSYPGRELAPGGYIGRVCPECGWVWGHGQQLELLPAKVVAFFTLLGGDPDANA